MRAYLTNLAIVGVIASLVIVPFLALKSCGDKEMGKWEALQRGDKTHKE